MMMLAYLAIVLVLVLLVARVVLRSTSLAQQVTGALVLVVLLLRLFLVK
jgi:hypothetical protein